MSLKKFLLLCLAFIAMSASGCETIKGTAGGMKKDFQGVNLHLQDADNWIKENLW